MLGGTRYKGPCKKIFFQTMEQQDTWNRDWTQWYKKTYGTLLEPWYEYPLDQ